jgi:CheY-like chemotaxis protein
MPAILIVEDDKHQRLLLEEELQREGHTTVAAATAREAIRAVSRTMPDLVVLDIRMPDMDGIELLGKLVGLNLRLPIVIYTAYDVYQDRFLACGADAYVLKRSDLSELKDTIRRVMDGRSLLPALPPLSSACAL